MSFASDFRAAIRQETDEELAQMAQADDLLSRIAQDEIRRRERERAAAESR
jgi:PHD/YefM family antitoxin component YafN of YafNO toxin-antitoxin module